MAARAALIAAAWVALAPASAGAHRLAPSLLELAAEGAGVFELAWKQPLLQPRQAALRPRLPERCAPLGEPRLERDAESATLRQRLDCGERGLLGARLGVDGLAESGGQALLRLALEDGRVVRAVLDARRESLVVPARPRRQDVVLDYAGLGFAHILAGLDHLLFVLGLVLLVAGRRSLLLAVTAFTVGHSLTLSLSVLGLVGVSPAWAELAIAASIGVVALELADPQGASRLRPWAAAGLFGLVHGLGFAGALRQAGLPQGEIPLALGCFNAGIEGGQLVFVAGVLALARPLRRLAPLPAYAMGALAAFWCLERLGEVL